MNVVEPARYRTRQKPWRWKPYAVIPIVTILISGAINYLRPLPAATANVHVSVPNTKSPSIQWATSGQSAVAAERYGLLGTSGNQSSLATASVAKVITALCVLQKAPIKPGQSGPTYTIGAQDVATYNDYAAQDSSLVPVYQGEQITEYQALEALMIPSANNMTDSLVSWVFGGQGNYSTYASEFLQRNGLDNTHIGTDASGFDPSTTSTASDLAQLGLLAMENPVLMQIAGQKSTTLPVVGRVANYNTVLGQNGITGLKTGNNDADPGSFIFTANTTVGNTAISISGAVMGAASLNDALQESVRLAGSFEQSFEQVDVVTAGKPVGSMHTEWGASAAIVPASSAQVTRWKATPITTSHEINARIRSGTVGTLRATAGPSSTSVNLKLAHTIAPPSFWWRLTRH